MKKIDCFHPGFSYCLSHLFAAIDNLDDIIYSGYSYRLDFVPDSEFPHFDFRSGEPGFFSVFSFRIPENLDYPLSCPRICSVLDESFLYEQYKKWERRVFSK